jgi:hypothetical protein
MAFSKFPELTAERCPLNFIGDKWVHVSAIYEILKLSELEVIYFIFE